ncbi:forespore capture DNA-binding protein RefZ [Priestia endophytica]|jgi:AcrR family transcriptional regulator|uniref:forespore capture DNA-binding protein RefZ n=1 Tax=Priestia endophytica TaxID=135735 RepID=UPI000F996B16|nr:forespore capture DNA-binding protein RefZ [Priestia endophytica]MCY8234290.1 forespore capture DNA-binding protein RefZ [Priestia endophytica]RPK16046.1 hypothetical protein FH5_01486 [Priestia endophytica]
MLKEKVETKERVLDAAVSLFQIKGFNGTSVREIAKKAGVNVANISYYFDGKEGLLEYIVTKFFEGYIKEMDKVWRSFQNRPVRECFGQMLFHVMKYQHEHREVARVIYRELSVDTTFVREIMSTYLTKEKYYLKMLLELGMKRKEFRHVSVSFTIMQLKGMMTMPYLHQQYAAEVLHVLTHEEYFVTKYTSELQQWINEHICLPCTPLQLVVK